jgi:hypothetical protein
MKVQLSIYMLNNASHCGRANTVCHPVVKTERSGVKITQNVTKSSRTHKWTRGVFRVGLTTNIHTHTASECMRDGTGRGLYENEVKRKVMTTQSCAHPNEHR